MDDDLQKNTSVNPSDIPEDVSSSEERVFDISGDTISLVKEDGTAAPISSTPKQSISSRGSTPSQPSTKKPPFDLDTDNLLDTKIGTFDASPFAQAKSDTQVPPVQTSRPIADLGQQPVQDSPSVSPILVKSKPGPIPLKDISTTLNKITQGPAGTFVKTSINESNPIIPAAKKSLQDSVASVLQAQKFGPNAKISNQNDQQATKPPVPTQTQAPVFSDADGILKPLRTYEGDVAEVMSHKRHSVASIAIAEAKKEEGEESLSTAEPRQTGKKLFLVVLSLILLGGGVIGAYYFYSMSPLAPRSPQSQQQQIAASIVPSDEQEVVVISSTMPATIQSQLMSVIERPQAGNTIKEVIVAQKNGTGTTLRIGGPDMIQLMDIDAPDILIRSLTDEWMLGVYADAEQKKSVFVVVTTDFFQNTFAGMLQWENIMADDLKHYLYPGSVQGISNAQTGEITLPDLSATSSSSSTVSSSSAVLAESTADPLVIETPAEERNLQSYFTLRGRFVDKIVKNRDVRAFRTETGETLFLYSFIDNTHLVVAKK